MLTNINPPERAVFGETSSGTYQTVKYDKDATNLIPINPNDPNVLNNNKTLTDWQKGIEAIATLDGQKATAIAGMYNTMMFDVTKAIQDYLRPLINEPWNATVKYNISSYVFDNATGVIYKSLVADNLGNALTDNTKWENTGANIQTYIKLIAQNATNITANIQAQKPIIFSYVNATTVNYTSGGFIFDDYTGSASVTAGTLNLAGLLTNASFYIFALYNPTTGAVQVQNYNTINPTLPAGFTKKKLIFASVTAGTSIRPFTMYADGYIVYHSLIAESQDIFTNNGDSLLKTITTVPDGVSCDVKMHLYSADKKNVYVGTATPYTLTTLGQGQFGIGEFPDVTFALPQSSGFFSQRTNTNRQVYISTWNFDGVLSVGVTLIIHGYTIIS